VQEVCLIDKETSNLKNSTNTGLPVKKPTGWNCTFTGVNGYCNTVQYKGVTTGGLVPPMIFEKRSRCSNRAINYSNNTHSV